MKLNLNQATIGQKFINRFSTNRSGDIAEQFVIFEAMLRGAEVFCNVGCDGKTDMVLKINGKLYEIDVKIAEWHYGLWKSKAHRVKLPIYPVIVEPANHGYKARWSLYHGGGPNARKKCPLGLEDFWDKTIT